MASEHLPHQSSEEDNRIIDTEIAREAAEAERPLRNALHHGKAFLRDKPDFQSSVERLANAAGSVAAERALELRQVHKLIRDGHDILQSAGALDALVKYARYLEEALATDHQSGT
jgi:HPt (histidine-containing phosphotransfer) domain-containing protein